MYESDRGQTEPNAALIAVSFMVLAVGLFAGYHADVIGDESERAIERPALAQIHDHITKKGQFDSSTTVRQTLEPVHLPRGQSVYIRISFIDSQGEEQTVDQAYFDGDGTYQRARPESSPPATARNNSRPLVVKRPTDRTHGARLYVTVWD